MAIGSRAYNEYGQALKTGELTAIPRNKYSFTVSIDTIDKPYEFIRIANVQMPSFTYRSQTINNYNNKSIVQTGIDYTPITLTAYDTKDAAFEEFLKNYARHYVAGPMNEESYVEWLANPNNKGLELRDTNHYIKKMVIERVDGKSLTNKIEIFHPFIANADADTLDYSDSSPTVFRVSFNYEGYNILSSDTALPPQLQKPVETITPLKHAEEFADVSSIYVMDNEKEILESNVTATSVTSNKSELIPIEFGPGNRPSNVYGIARPTTSEERAVREEEIKNVIRTGKVVAEDGEYYPFVEGEGMQLVKYQGKTYMATVSGPN